jgi:hypothetical protein
MIVRRMADHLRDITDAHEQLYKRIEAHCQQAYDLAVECEGVLARYRDGDIVTTPDVAMQSMSMYAAIAGALISAPKEIPTLYGKAAFALAYNEAHAPLVPHIRSLKGAQD